MKNLIIFLKIFAVGAVFTIPPLWLAVSHIEIFINICMALVVVFGIFMVGSVILYYSNEINRLVFGKDE